MDARYAVLSEIEILANGLWGWETPTGARESVVMDFTIREDPGHFSEDYALGVALGWGTVGSTRFNFGIQTDVDDPDTDGSEGKGIFFNLWGSNNTAQARPTYDGWVVTGSTPGDFIGIRKPYEWSAGDYRVLFAPYSNDDDDGRWYGIWIRNVTTNMQTYVGSLKFPLVDAAPPMINPGRDGYSTSLVILGDSIIATHEIPLFEVALSPPNELKRPDESRNIEMPKRVTASYSTVHGTITNAKVFFDRESNLVIMKAGGDIDSLDTPGSTFAILNYPATGTPVVEGLTRVGVPLWVDTSGIADADGLANSRFTYQWIRHDRISDSEIPGAVNDYYTLTSHDVDKNIKVRVSFIDDAGFSETRTSAATAVVKPRTNTPASGFPVISGTLQVGETLTADTQGISDADGVEKALFNCRWLADDTEIDGATGASYTLTSAERGKAIKVEVSFTDDRGYSETLTSAATGAVEPEPNTPATGTPVITGTVQVGETLTVDTSGISDENGLKDISYAYQWLADDTEINGATDSSYRLTLAERGKAIKVQVSFTDDWGYSETLTSAATSAVEAQPNISATGTLAITGTVQVGETLTVDTSGIRDGNGLENVSYAYRWLADYAVIDGARGNSYTLTSAEQGKAIKVRVSFTDDAGYAEALISAATGAVEAEPNIPASGAPFIIGTVHVGMTLTLDTHGIRDDNGLSNVSYAYQWLADDSEIDGATGEIYTLTLAERGKAIKVRVSFTDDRGNSETLTSAATDTVQAEPNIPASGAPIIYGGAQVAETLTVDTYDIRDDNGLGNVSYAYQWLADDTEIDGATDEIYTLTLAERGKAIRVRVSFTDYRGYSETLTSAATGTVEAKPNIPAIGELAVTGTAQVSDTLTADTSGIRDGNGLGNVSYAYQWLADDTEIDGATGHSYTLTLAERGKAIRVRVSFTDNQGHSETLTSAATGAVEAEANITATGTPTITGTLQVRETLTVVTSGISDDNGLENVSYAYQWLADNTAIDGATGVSYRLTSAEQGKAIKVRVSFTDDAGYAEALTSAATVAVEAEPNISATGTPAITGTVQVGETLTVDTSGISDDNSLDNVSYVYQWLADDTEIDGATGSNYRLTSAERGKAVKVRVSFTDDRGYSETLTSAATAAVEAMPNILATGTPTITGTIQVGETLKADTSGINDDNGLDNVSYAYQWLGDDTEIQGATASSYTLTSAERGKAVKVRVSFTDDRGYSETLTSAATAAVEAEPNIPATGTPTITGTVHVRDALKVDTSGVSDENGLDDVSYAYQWLADDTAIDGAAGSSYRLTSAEQGKAIKVRVSFTDDAGYAEALTSAATGTVATELPTVWSVDMTVTDFGNGDLGANSPDLFSNETGDLDVVWLWYSSRNREIHLSFSGLVLNAAESTLKLDDVSLPFPAGSSGTAFTFTDVDISWTHGQSVAARIVR